MVEMRSGGGGDRPGQPGLEPHSGSGVCLGYRQF
jgi:hypothetical protein